MASTRGPLDASLFSSTPAPASPAPAAAGPGLGPAGAGKDDDTSVLAKGQPVWYWHARSGAWMAAKVTFVDLSLSPPAYQVVTLEDENVRDTERPRLRPRIEEQASSGPAGASAGPATGPGSAAAAAAAARAAAAAGASAAATAPPAPTSSYATVLHSEDPNAVSGDKRAGSSWEHIASSKAAATHPSMLASMKSAAAQDVADDWGTFASAVTHGGLDGVHRGPSYVPRAEGSAANGRAPDSSMSERAAETRSPPTTAAAAAAAAAGAEDDDYFGDFASAPPALHSTTDSSPLTSERPLNQNSAASGAGTASQGGTALPSHPQSSTAQRETGRTNAWTSDGSATRPSPELVFAATANGFSHAPAASTPSPQARDHSHATQPRALSPSPLTHTSKAQPAQPPALGVTRVASPPEDFSTDAAVTHQHQAPRIASVATPPATPLDVGCVHTPPASAASVADNAAAAPARPEASAASPPAPAAAAAPDDDWDIDWGDFTSHAEVELSVHATAAPGTHGIAAAPPAAPDGDDDWGNFTALPDAPLNPSAGAALEGNGREAPVDAAVPDDDWGEFTPHVVAGRADTTRMADTGSTKPAAHGSDDDDQKVMIDGALSSHRQQGTFTGAAVHSDTSARDASMFAPPLTGVRTSPKSAEPETRGAMSHVSSSEDATFRTGGSSFVSNLTTPPGTARADPNAFPSDSTFVSPGDTGNLCAPSSAAGSAPVSPQAAAVGSARSSVEKGASGSPQLDADASRCLSTLSSPPASARAALPADSFRLDGAESFAADSDADASARDGPKEAVLRRNVMFSGDMGSLDLAMNFAFDDAGTPSAAAAAADCATWSSMDAPGDVQRAVSRPAIAAEPHGKVGDEIPVDSEPLAEVSGALDVAWTEDSAAVACSQPLSAADSVPLQAPAGDAHDAGAGASGAAAHIGHARVINSLAFEPDFPAGPHDGVTLDDNPVFSPRTSADAAYVGPGSRVRRTASGARATSGTTQHIEQLAGPAGGALSLPVSNGKVPERESGKGTAAPDEWADFSRAASDPVPPHSCAGASQLPLNAAPTYLSSVNDAPVAHFTGDLDSLSSLSSPASGSHALDLPEANLPGSPRAAAPPTSGMPPTPLTSRKDRSAALSSVPSIATREAAGPFVTHAARASMEKPARTATADASDPFAASLDLSVSIASHPYDDIDVVDALDAPLAAESTRHDSASMARTSMRSEPALTRERLSSHPLHASASLLELGGASVPCSPPAEASSDNAVMAQPSGAQADGPPGAAVPRVAMKSGIGTPAQCPQRAASPFERHGHGAPEADAAPTFTAAAKLEAEADADRVTVDSGAATAACTVPSASETMIASKGGSLGKEQSREDASTTSGDAALGGPGNDPKNAVVDPSEVEEDEWGDFAAASTRNTDNSGAVEFMSASDRDEEHTNSEAAETPRGSDERARCSSPQPRRASNARSSPRALDGHAAGDAERSVEPEVPHLRCAPLHSPLTNTGLDAAWEKSVELGPGPGAHAQGAPETSVDQVDPGLDLIRCGSSTGTAVLRHGESLGYSEPDDLTRTGDTLNAASRVLSTSTRDDASASASESSETPRSPLASGDEVGPGTIKASAGLIVSVRGDRGNGVDDGGVLAVEDALSELLRTADSGAVAVDDALSEMLRSVDSGVLAVEDALSEMLRAVDEADMPDDVAASGVAADDIARTDTRPMEQGSDDQISDTSARDTPEVMADVLPSGVDPAKSTPVASVTSVPTRATSPLSSAATSVAQAPEAELGPELSAEEAALQAQLAAATQEAMASGALRTALAHTCIHVLHLAAITAAVNSARGIAAEGAVAAAPDFWRTAHTAHRLASELAEAPWPVAPTPPKALPARAAPPSIRNTVYAGVRLFTSSMGGSSKVTADTRRIVHILEAFAVPYEVVDLSITPDRRLAMLETSEGEAALPQLHAHGAYIGDAGQCLELHDFGELVPELQGAATADDAAAIDPEVLPGDATSNRDSNDVDHLTDELRGQLREAVNDARLADALAAVGDLHGSVSDSVDDSRPANQGERSSERCRLSGLPLTGWRSDDVRSVDGLREVLGDRLDGMTGRCIVCAAQLLCRALQSD